MLTKLRQLYYDLKIGISNLLVYFPVIFKTREYDFSFIYIILQFKLKQTRTYLEKTNYISDIEIISKQIRICENLIERLLANDYNAFLHEKHREKFGDLNFEYIFDNSTYKYSKCKTNEETILADHEMTELYKLDSNAYSRDKKLLFKLIEKYIEYWWE